MVLSLGLLVYEDCLVVEEEKDFLVVGVVELWFLRSR